MAAVFAVLCFSWVGAAAAHSVVIELPTRVSVDAAAVRLGDVARLRTPDLSVLRQLMVLPIGRTPQAGEGVFLEREALARWVRLQTGLGPEHIRWEGASTVEVSMATQAVSGDEVARVAQTALQEWLQPRSQRMQVQAVIMPSDLSLPHGAVSLVVRPVGDVEPRKRMLVWVDAFLEGNFVRSVPVTFAVSAWGQAPVALRSAPIGASLTMQEIGMSEVDITTVSGASARSDVREKLLNQPLRLRRPVRAGEVLTMAHVEPVPAVVRGGWVKLQFNVGTVSVERPAQALQDGRQGQLVRVKPDNISASLMARVTGPGLVEVPQ